MNTCSIILKTVSKYIDWILKHGGSETVIAINVLLNSQILSGL